MEEVPRYLTIKREISRQIRTRQLLPNDSLPGRWKLTEQYGCSWATVNRAIQELIIEGKLYAEKGKGTFVSSGAVEDEDPTRTISVLLCNFSESVYYSVLAMMDGIREAAASRGSPVQFVDMHESGRFGDLDHRIIITPALADFPYLAEAAAQGDRFVVLGAEFHAHGGKWVNSDTREGTRKAILRMLADGHRRILLFGLKRGFSNYELKISGYADALREYGLPADPEWIVYRPESAADVVDVLDRSMRDHPSCTAVFAADYTSGLSVLGWAMENGIRIPEDLSLFVMGEVPSSPHLRVPPNSVVQPFEDMGRHAVRMLLDEDDRPFSLLPCRLIVRNSVMPRLISG